MSARDVPQCTGGVPHRPGKDHSLISTRLLSSTAAIALALSACGGGGAGGGGDAQTEVADLFIEVAEGEDLELDGDCVREAAEGFSDDDAQAIVDAGVGGNPDVSDEADAIGDEIFNCLSIDSFVDSLVAGLEDDDDVDAECVRAELEGFDMPDAVQGALFDAAIACSSTADG